MLTLCDDHNDANRPRKRVALKTITMKANTTTERRYKLYPNLTSAITAYLAHFLLLPLINAVNAMHGPYFYSQSVTGLCLALLSNTICQAQLLAPAKQPGCVRVATYNASLNRATEGKLTEDLNSQAFQIRAVAAVVRDVQPDILLVNEIDFSSQNDNAALLEQNFFAASNPDDLGGLGWSMPFHFSAPVNTGIPSGMDLNNNGQHGEAEDAFGFGQFPGQYGMAIFSRFEIDVNRATTLQRFLWSNLPSPQKPQQGGNPFYAEAIWSKLRLSSKSFWDLPIKTPQGTLHLLASHPTPPAFDGLEDRNGCRNHDEIKLIHLYIESSEVLRDDQGQPVRFSDHSPFVILGDLNSDPRDGNSRSEAIRSLLSHPQISQFPAPRSLGATTAARDQGAANQYHQGDPAEDTADFSDHEVGNLRADYVLPSKHCQPFANGVVWPDLSSINPNKREAVKLLMDASDHHMVWVDIKMP
jgi:endonuclease/exonuclease/phosphatase family metal-dependent hydrolase